MNIAWPGWRTTAWHAEVKERDIRAWWGGLVDGMRDASGQMYMRNRYYDPATGQFTQQDPIGLAGGLNSYGFAAGDPVSYDDPGGLEIQCKTRAACRLMRQVEQKLTQSVNSRDESVRQAALGLQGVITALKDAPQVIEIHAHNNGRIDRFMGRNVVTTSLGRAFWPLNYSGRGTYQDAHCRVPGSAATVWVDTEIMRNINAAVRVVHELGHVYAHEIERAPWHSISQPRAIEIENLYLTIEGCRHRPTTSSEGGWQGPSCR